jgi:hypothetical protein
MQSIRSPSTDWHDLLLAECDIRVASAEAALPQVSILPFWDELIQRGVEVLDPAVRARRFAHGVDLRGGCKAYGATSDALFFRGLGH